MKLFINILQIIISLVLSIIAVATLGFVLLFSIVAFLFGGFIIPIVVIGVALVIIMAWAIKTTIFENDEE